jgi:hypothetical protein
MDRMRISCGALSCRRLGDGQPGDEFWTQRVPAAATRRVGLWWLSSASLPFTRSRISLLGLCAVLASCSTTEIYEPSDAARVSTAKAPGRISSFVANQTVGCPQIIDWAQLAVSDAARLRST